MTLEALEPEARALEHQLERLAPRIPWRRTVGVELPPHGDDFAYELARQRRDWLLGRWQELSARADRRLAQAKARAQGVSRFLGEGMTLDDLIATTLDTPAALQELNQARHEDRQAVRSEAA